ncbi:MAG: 1-deoxy-D-xylulose-5-phosphate reductoisomerase [Clostridia bacterium]|nr:1-deoxy-D-xylulose-5-phosphate reductoisomerase [Clostridia bacterium]
MQKKISILGSTGSIGRQTLEVVEQFPHQLEVVGLAAGNNLDLLIQQVKRFRPLAISVMEESLLPQLREALAVEVPGYRTEIYCGLDGLVQIATMAEIEMVVTAVSGAVGLIPTIKAIEAGKNIALANKETLVVAGSLVSQLARKKQISIYPVDSEHSAIFQALEGNRREEVRKLILTASGGPFRGKSWAQLQEVTLEMALRHPRWEMGQKITIDSATLMNKGLEVIEAHWLFDIPFEQIEVIIHPQSIIHSMVEYRDGSIIAQMGITDMRIPIQYALSYPQRWPNNIPSLDFAVWRELTFDRPDLEAFPCLAYAFAAGRTGGTMPAVMNGANEAAVGLFLKGAISFTGITRLVEQVMNTHQVVHNPSLEEILSADKWSRAEVNRLCQFQGW